MRRSTSLCLCLVVFAVCAESDERESKLVKTAQGVVRGYKDPEHGIYAFQSIPYATAPTGLNRFKAPLPPPVWLHTFDAIDKRIICPQVSQLKPKFRLSNPSMQEDCLIANVFIPDTEETNLPVVVYVHGGTFQVGWGNKLVHKRLVSEHNIILVNFNYRLGIHGFLCLGTDDAPGNAGMKDQVELLRWVKTNIASFGGNPDDVTLAGYSAGSVSVNLLMLSKSAEGLFNKVIAESASLSSIQSEPLENGKWFAKAHNFTNVEDVYALEQFYKTALLEFLIEDLFSEEHDSAFVFTPCVERASKEAFLEKSSDDILKIGHYKKVPVLYGISNMEGLTRSSCFDSWKSKMNKKFSDFLPPDLKFESEEQKEEIGKAVKAFYFGDKPVDDEHILAYIDYFTDTKYAYPTLRSIRMMTENGHDQIFLYEYSFVDGNTPVIPHTNITGASHCAQTLAVLGESLNRNDTLTEDFKKLSFKVRHLWANFIKTGKPVPVGSEFPSWPAVRRDWAPHMSLGKELQLRGSLLERRALFWDNIYAEHYRNPLPPPPPERQAIHQP